MDFMQAIGRLKNRDHYLAEQIVQRTDNKVHWFQLDREAIALAIECIEYTKAMQEFEAAQPKE